MKRLILIAVFMTFPLVLLFSEKIQTFRLDHITVSDGLPNSSVSAVVQDGLGYMWFGTQSGLTRYDGYTFITYLNDPFNSNSLPHNQIQTMYMDKNNMLWLGTYYGLSRFDIESGIFTNYLSEENDESTLSNDVVVAIERDSSGRLWVGTLDGLNLLNEEDGTFTRFFHADNDPYSLPDNTVRAILNDKNGTLWIGTYGGLSYWNDKEKKFVKHTCSEEDIQNQIQNLKNNPSASDMYGDQSDESILSRLGMIVNEKTIPSNYVMTLKNHPFLDNVIIVGTWEGTDSPGGIALFNTETMTAERIDTPAKRVYSLMTDDRNRMWIGTWGGGLVIYNMESGEYNLYSNAKNDELSHDIVYSLFRDFSGVVWIGTSGGGIDKYIDWKNLYNFFNNNPDNPYSLPSGKVNTILEDSNGYIWVVVQGKGISRYNPDTGLFKNYTSEKDDPRSLSTSLVNVLFEDSKGNLWVGTSAGLDLYNRDSDDFERLSSTMEKKSLPDNLIYSMAEDREGNLWLGSYTKGIIVYSFETNTFRHYENDKEDQSSLSDNLVRSIYIDSRGSVWACTNKGLNRYDPENDSFVRYLHDSHDRSSISSNDVRRVFEDSDGDLWFATNGGGVNLYNRNTDSFSLISTSDGLLSNSVMAIGEDDLGRILFITIPGISIYNKRDKSFSVIDKKTGLMSSELTHGFLKASDGSLYIGGVNGITHIPVLQTNRVNYTPKVNINGVSVLGIPYNQNGRAAWSLNNLILDSGENTLGFDFTLSDYSSDGQNQFAYRLEGVDSDWVYSGTRNFARYTNLSPGSYTFHVIGADSRNNWNLDGTSLSFTIRPPFWRSVFAYISYGLLLFLVFLLIFFRIKNDQEEALLKMEEQKALNFELENRVRKRTAQIEEARRVAEKATKAKSLFLANMSHELRTPLNAVVGFSELLNEEDYSPEKRHIITSIKTAGKSLSTLINDLLDLSKLEAGKMTIKENPVNISRVLFEIRHIFHLRIKEKGLKFALEVDPRIPESIMIDETRFRQILINLMGNSIKFTDSGQIDIKVQVLRFNPGNTIDLKIDVSDTGCGIGRRDLQKIFDLFWQSEGRELDKPSGTGLGLSITKNLVNLMNGSIDVQSEVGKGTTVSILFKDMETVDEEEESYSEKNKKKLKFRRFDNVKVVIADDIADNRNLLMEIMKQMDISAFSAENGKEALSIVAREIPDIVFMDLQMPVMDGYTAASRLKESHLTESIPIVAVTASLQNELFDGDGDKINYFSDYITKPYSIDNIRDVLFRYAGHKLQQNVSAIKSPDKGTTKSPIKRGIDDQDNLILRLEEFLEEWKDLKPSGRISRLENFALRLRDVGKRHNAHSLISYAETFLTHIKVFDIKAIEKELNRFPSMVDSIRPQ